MERRSGFSLEQHAKAGNLLREVEVGLRTLFLELERAYGKNHPATLRADRLVFGGTKSQFWGLRNALDTLASREMPADAFVTGLYFGPESEIREARVAPSPAGPRLTCGGELETGAEL